MAEVLGNIGIGKSLLGNMVVLLAHGGVCALVDKGPRLVCDAHGGLQVGYVPQLQFWVTPIQGLELRDAPESGRSWLSRRGGSSGSGRGAASGEGSGSWPSACEVLGLRRIAAAPAIDAWIISLRARRAG